MTAQKENHNELNSLGDPTLLVCLIVADLFCLCCRWDPHPSAQDDQQAEPPKEADGEDDQQAPDPYAAELGLKKRHATSDREHQHLNRNTQRDWRVRSDLDLAQQSKNAEHGPGQLPRRE